MTPRGVDGQRLEQKPGAPTLHSCINVKQLTCQVFWPDFMGLEPARELHPCQILTTSVSIWSPSQGWRGGSFQTQFLDAIPQLPEAHPEQFCGGSLVVAGLFQRLADRFLLHLAQLLSERLCPGPRHGFGLVSISGGLQLDIAGPDQFTL